MEQIHASWSKFASHGASPRAMEQKHTLASKSARDGANPHAMEQIHAPWSKSACHGANSRVMEQIRKPWSKSASHGANPHVMEQDRTPWSKSARHGAHPNATEQVREPWSKSKRHGAIPLVIIWHHTCNKRSSSTISIFRWPFCLMMPFVSKSVKRRLNVSGVVPKYEATSFLLIGNSIKLLPLSSTKSVKNKAMRVSTVSETKLAVCFSEFANRLANSFKTLIEIVGYLSNNCCKSFRLMTQIFESTIASA